MPRGHCEEAVRVAVEVGRAVRVEAAVGVVGRLVGGHVDDEAPVTTRGKVNELAEAAADFPQKRAVRRIGLQSNR